MPAIFFDLQRGFLVDESQLKCFEISMKSDEILLHLIDDTCQ